MSHDLPLEALLVSVSRGEQAALRAIYHRENTRLFGIAVGILRDRSAAADAVQDAFLRMWERAGQFDPAKGAASAWIGAVVRHAALDLARRRGREQPTDDATLGDMPVDADALDRLAATEEGARLRACLAQLDAKLFPCIVWAFVHGLSHAQIADKAGMPLGTVKTWIRRGLASLRECLS